MTTNIPLLSRPLSPAAASPEVVATALDRIAFAALCGFIFTVPWGDGFLFIGPLLLVNWLGAVAFGSAALSVIIKGRLRKPNTLHYRMLAFAAWSALSILWTVDSDTTATRAGTYLQMLVCVWLVWELARTETRVLGLLQSYVLGALVASSSAIYNLLMGRTTAQLSAADGLVEWDTQRYSIAGVNANDLGLILALSLPMTFYLLASRRRTVVKILCWIQLVLGFTAIVLTGSRGSMAAAVVALIMLPLSFSRLAWGHRFMLLVACACALAATVYLVPPASWLRILSFGDELSSGSLTNRTILWTAGLDVFRNHPFLGIGSGAYGSAISGAADFGYISGEAAKGVAHNTFVSVLVELGVVGALFLIVLLGSTFYSSFQMPKLRRSLWMTLLLAWTVGVSSLTWEYRKVTWILLALAAAHACVRRTGGPAPAPRVG